MYYMFCTCLHGKCIIKLWLLQLIQSLFARYEVNVVKTEGVWPVTPLYMVA